MQSKNVYANLLLLDFKHCRVLPYISSYVKLINSKET